MESTARFPGESEQCRTARNELVTAERELRRHVEQVAQLRRGLPLGGGVPHDYQFDEPTGPVKLSGLFQPGLDTLAIYSFMYGPEMKSACPMCTAFLDSLNGAAQHISQRMNLALVAKSPVPRLQEFAQARGWNHLRLISSANNTYNRDYYGEDEKGAQLTMMNVFVRRDGRIYHYYATELAFDPADPGQNQRHIDMMWPLWNVLDLTPEGRGTDWFPKLTY